MIATTTLIIITTTLIIITITTIITIIILIVITIIIIIRALYQEEERCDDDHPVAEESKQFWGNIWRRSTDHKKDAKWLQDLRSEVSVTKQEKINITKGSLKKILGRMSN